MLSPVSVLPLHLACQFLVSQNFSYPVNVQLNTTIPKQATEFPSGYIVVPDLGVAYKYYNYKAQWDVARKYCLADGGYLAIVDSYEKLQFVMDMNKSGSHLHVGFHKLFDPAEWTNLKTGLPAKTIPWRHDVIAGPNRFCAAVIQDRSGIVNIGCGEPYTFVCELSIFHE